MFGEDGFASVQIGYGARDFQDAVVGTGGEVETLHGGTKKNHAVGVGLGVLVQEARSHLGIAMDARKAGKAFGLYLAGTDDPFADGGAGLACLAFGKLLEGYRNDFHLDVNPVEEGAGDTVQVLLYLPGRTYTMAGGVVVISAGGGVHRGYQGEAGGIIQGIFGARNGDVPVFEGLAEDFEDASVELGKLVEEEDAIVCQTDFTRLGIGAPAHHGDLRNGVVRASERTNGDEGRVFSQFSGYGMYLGGFQAFGERKGRKDAGKAFCHHRLAASRRAYHNQVVSACRCNLQGTFHAFLTLDIGKVEREIGLAPVKFLARIDDSRFQFALAVEEIDDFGDVFHAVHVQVIDHGGFTRVLLGEDESFESLLAGADGYGQGAFDGLEASGQAQFAYEEVTVELFGGYCSRYRQDA